jgi:hypothetical protein
LSSWIKTLQDCNGNTNCLEECGKELRACLDRAFPPSTKLEFESDKINYMLSTIFFLSNRLTKAITGLSEIDKAIGDIVKEENQSLDSSSEENKRNYEKVEKELNEILSKYF